VKDLITFLLEPVYAPERSALLQDPGAAALRGVLYQLDQGLGSARRQDVAPQLALLRAADRSALARWSVQLGRASVFAQAMLTAERLHIREALCFAAMAAKEDLPGVRPGPEIQRSFRLRSAWDRQTTLMRGYVGFGTWAVRCDLTEQAIRELSRLPASAPPEQATGIVQRILECDEAQALAISRSLPRSRSDKGPKKRRRRKRHKPPTAAD
jgi:ATP-dependent RNA helicase SUPV3L1/SUV3